MSTLGGWCPFQRVRQQIIRPARIGHEPEMVMRYFLNMTSSKTDTGKHLNLQIRCSSSTEDQITSPCILRPPWKAVCFARQSVWISDKCSHYFQIQILSTRLPPFNLSLRVTLSVSQLSEDINLSSLQLLTRRAAAKESQTTQEEGNSLTESRNICVAY